MLRNKLVSTTIIILTTFAFAVSFAGGDDDDDSDGGVPPKPPSRFTLLYNDEVVRDNETGLEWPRIPNDATTIVTCLITKTMETV